MAVQPQSFREDLKRRLSSRKFQITVVGFITSTVLLIYGFLPPDQYINFLKWLFAAYVAGNVGEHFSKGPAAQAMFSSKNKK